MNKILLLTVALTLFAAPLDASGRVVRPGDQAPDTRGRDASGVLHVIDFSEAELTLLNFWATWCEPCKREMPVLQEAQDTLGPRGLRVIGITHERIENEDLAEFLDQMGITYTVFRAGESIKKYWVGTQGSLPNSYLIGKDGRVIRRYVGASPEQIAQLRGDLVDVLEGRPLGTLIMPGEGDVATSEDRVRQEKEEAERKKKAEEESDGS
ncbi:MAG: redoxin domain-containing protein [Acidobacteria bacterium]|nr:redoxin domain-containing protein [Acidobacteriota bacterium]NIQ30227.1 redoxin domain-containing protein [Acidobacteriota bacterium]NIQ85155.1 redoxin domain-containing protein [Acidobacteriota bacterium]